MSAAQSPSKPPFIYRGLEQHYSIDLVSDGALERESEVLHRAASIGLNRVYIGERWPDLGLRLIDYRNSFPELVTPERNADAAKRREVFERICRDALSVGIEPWVNLNIINYPDAFLQLFPEAIATPPPTADRWLRSPGPRGLAKQPQICFSSEPYKKLLKAQFSELCRLPHIGGIECWMTASDSDPFYCVCEKCNPKSVADVIVEFAEMAHAVCVAHGKKLLLRCYLGGWRCALETEVWLEAAPRIPADVEIGYKQVHGDMMNWHGPNPLAGKLAPHTEHVEFDLGGEYRGCNYAMVCSIRWQLQELIRHFRDEGVPVITCRSLDSQHLFDMDKWLFGALTLNPDLDVAAWCSEWAAKRYGPAGDEVVSILDEAAEVIRLAMHVQGVQWASWAVPQNVARLRFILFDRCAPCVPGSYERLQPTAENIAKIMEEKKLALEKAEVLLAKCAKLKGKLEEKFFAPLFASMTYLRAYTLITGPLMESFFRFSAWSQTNSEVTREYIRIPLLASIAKGKREIEEASKIVQGLDTALLISLTDRAGFVDPKALNKFLEPFQYASTILDEIAQGIDTVSASWWAYYPSPDRWPESLGKRTELYRKL
jgi:hypothetical protein